MAAVDQEIALFMAYAPAAARPALETIWMLDAQLGGIVRSTREPIIGAMRLTWWRDAIEELADAPPPAEPLLQRLHATLAGSGQGARPLADMAEGWMLLLEPMPLADAALDEYARLRGGVLFGGLARALGAVEEPMIAEAGAGWALVDFALRCSDRATAQAARARAIPMLQRALAARWPRAARPLGMLAHLALRDAAAGPDARRRPGSPRRMLRMLGHRLTGR